MNINNLVPFDIKQKIKTFIDLITPKLKDDTYFITINAHDNYTEYLVSISEWAEPMGANHQFIEIKINENTAFLWNKSTNVAIVTDLKLTRHFFRALED